MLDICFQNRSCWRAKTPAGKGLRDLHRSDRWLFSYSNATLPQELPLLPPTRLTVAVRNLICLNAQLCMNVTAALKESRNEHHDFFFKHLDSKAWFCETNELHFVETHVHPTSNSAQFVSYSGVSISTAADLSRTAQQTHSILFSVIFTQMSLR